MLQDLLKSRMAKRPAPASLAGDAKAALQSRTSIQLHEGSFDDARARGVPILLITVRDGAADASGKSPFDVALELRQQVVLKRAVLGSLMDRFIELWRAAN